MIQNPILKGFNPDPCICRKGDDYYIAVSSFEWMPGIPVYHSRDLKHWELYTHILTDDAKPNLTRLPSAKGIWAPCLTYCAAENLFYVVYGVMNSMNARYFDVNNYIIKAPDLKGPWSEPVYAHSSGFDASLFHDRDGRKYLASLEWETRENYEKPGVVCLVEYDPVAEKVIGYPRRIWRGGTDRGCIEAPHITRRGEYYYIMCAEGGTGYNHCVTMGRSRNIWGPYEPDPQNPIVTSAPNNSNERRDPDHLKPQYFNPDSVLQKSGHASYVELPTGETYLVHLCARPFVPELRCTLGRETAIQKMQWTEDGWLRMADGSSLARERCEESALPPCPLPQTPSFDDFDSDTLGIFYYSPRISPSSCTDLTSRPGWLRIYGQESLCSLNRASLVARKLTSVCATVTTRLDFHPEVYQHMAGLVLYYDNMNYLFLRKYYSETLSGEALSITQLENGEKKEFLDVRTPLREEPICLRLNIRGRRCWFEWSYDNADFLRIGPDFDTTKYSDEYCKFGEFTGAVVGMACTDAALHCHPTDFDFFSYQAEEEKAVN
ncbi:MAG: glycoside hydrolase family 43 protein [Clostridiales bacterium]|nr:glycoside hydrolase family 43 protein [Clostridiales bacterium]